MTTPFRIPWGQPTLGEAECDAVLETLRSGWVSMGARVDAFERRLAALTGRRHAVALSSGTAALDVALKALGVGPGDEVIVPALAYIAAPNAVTYQGAAVVLADVRADDWTIDPADVERRITPRTRAVLALDYGGAPADYPALAALAQQHGLALVGDGAESLGATLEGRLAASYGVVSTTSFHAIKVLTTIEGGMLFTDDDALAQAARILRNQGEDPHHKYRHLVIGHNYRMTDLQAAIGLVQLDRLSGALASREATAARYNAQLQRLPLQAPRPRPDATSSWFLYSVLAPQRDKVRAHLAKRGIETRVSWPLPVHRQPCYEALLGSGRFPIAEHVARHVLSLPIYPGLGADEQDEVCAALAAVLRHIDPIATGRL